MSPSLKEIYWMSSPLGIAQREEIDRRVGKFLIPKVREVLDPKREWRWFRGIKHWTLEIDGWCYEMLPIAKEKIKAVRLFTDACKPQFTNAKAWHAFRNRHGIHPERRKVGRTRLTHEEIRAKISYIWENFNHGLYVFLVQNCQNFARMLHESIASDSEQAVWESIPKPISYSLADFSGGSVGTSASVGVVRLYLAAAADAVGGGVVQGGVSTVAGVGTAAITTAPADGAGVANAVGGSTSNALGTTQTATAGTSHGTAAGAGKAGLGVKGAAGGGASAGKVGLSAKVSSLGSGVMHSAGAAKLATAAKLGAAAAVAHPLAGVAVFGLGVLAAGKRDKDWIKNFGDADLSEADADSIVEFSISDALEVEETLLNLPEDVASESNTLNAKAAGDH